MAGRAHAILPYTLTGAARSTTPPYPPCEKHTIPVHFNQKNTPSGKVADIMFNLEFLKNLAQQCPETIALDDNDTEVTQQELVTAVSALAVALQTLDPIPGSRVAVCGIPDLNYLVAVLAIQAAGKILVPLNPNGSRQEMSDLLARTLPTAVIAADAMAGHIPCDDDLIIRHSQFAGLVRTYAGQTPETIDLNAIDAELPELGVTDPGVCGTA